MLVDERSVNSDGGSTDSSDSSSFSFLVNKTGRSHDDFLSNLPVDCVRHCQLSGSRVNGGRDGGPGCSPRGSVHGKFAVKAPYSLVSEERLLCSIVASVHDEGKRVGVRSLLSSCYEFSSIESDEASLNSQSLGVLKDNSSSVNSNALKNGSILIDHESGASWDHNKIIGYWRNVNSPSGSAAPSQNV